jgi:hypothetical protein
LASLPAAWRHGIYQTQRANRKAKSAMRNPVRRVRFRRSANVQSFPPAAASRAGA